MSSRWALIVLPLLLITQPLFADNPPAGEIAGTVVDNDGHPIQGATVDAWTWHPGNETTTGRGTGA